MVIFHAERGWSRYNFPIEMQEAGAQGQIQALLYQLYFRQHTSSRSALLELFREFCCIAGAEYIIDYLSYSPRTQRVPIPTPGPIEEMVFTEPFYLTDAYLE